MFAFTRKRGISINKKILLNKNFLLCFCTINVIFLSVYTIFRHWKSGNSLENPNVENKIIYYGGTIDINFYKEVDVDANSIVKSYFGMNNNYSGSERNDACWYWQIRSEAGYKNLCKNLELPNQFQEIELDFENNYYIISLGRKLENVIFYTTKKNEAPSFEHMDGVYPDYNMNDEYESKAYFYSMKKITFPLMDLEDLTTSKYGNTGDEFYANHLN